MPSRTHFQLIDLLCRLNHRKTIRSRIERELDLNYDAFDSVGDAPDWTFRRTHTPYGENNTSRGSTMDMTAVNGASFGEESFSFYSTHDEQAKETHEHHEGVRSQRVSSGDLADGRLPDSDRWTPTPSRS